MVATIAIFDLYNLFVNYIFGSFWLAVIGVALILFVIGGLLGKISIYSITWICVMYILAMCMGSGYVTLNIFITLALLVACIYAGKSYLTKEQ